MHAPLLQGACSVRWRAVGLLRKNDFTLNTRWASENNCPNQFIFLFLNARGTVGKGVVRGGKARKYIKNSALPYNLPTIARELPSLLYPTLPTNLPAGPAKHSMHQLEINYLDMELYKPAFHRRKKKPGQWPKKKEFKMNVSTTYCSLHSTSFHFTCSSHSENCLFTFPCRISIQHEESRSNENPTQR